MSVVVAIKEKGKVIIGADSQVSSGESKKTLLSPNNLKVWKVKNVKHCLMGHTGRVRNSNIIRVMDELVKKGEEIDFELVVKSIVPRIVKELEEYGCLDEKEIIDDIRSSFILAYKDKLFAIGRDGSVMEIVDYVALGSADDEAMSVLNVTEGEDPKIRIIKAIKSTIKNNLYVGGPIVITDTDKTEFEILT